MMFFKQRVAMIHSKSEENIPSLVNSEIMQSMLDPVRYEEYKQPIICPHGHTFEKGTLLEKITERGKLLQCATTGVYFPESDYRPNYIVHDLTKLINTIIENKKPQNREETELLKLSLQRMKEDRDYHKNMLAEQKDENKMYIEQIKQMNMRIKNLEDAQFFGDPKIQKVFVFIAATGYLAYRFFTTTIRKSNAISD
jgi:hypothetical protein